jgi:glycerol-1-phosphate dehydrogenase [NAD(P)+]
MVAKYVGLIDWQISALLTGEYYCEKIASLTRLGIDTLMGMADRVTVNDEETAGKIFEALLMTGLGMSFAQNSRPASGCEHLVAHLIECFELLEGKEPNLHGEDVGVATLEMLKLYSEMAKHEKIHGKRESVDWDDVYATFGPMADDVRKLNEPKTVADEVDPKFLEDNWQKIRDIIASVPSYEECLEAMTKAGCKLTVDDIGKSQELFGSCIKYSPFMRKRLTLLRLLGMIDR